MTMDYIINAISGDEMVALRVINSLATVEKARQIHKTEPTATAALGRALTAASLMGCDLKGEEDTLTLKFKGDGPLGSIFAESDSSGNARGYVENPQTELPLNADGKLDVGGAIGKGSLTVMKDLGLKEPYIGQIELVSGEIAEDITHYLFTSEQTPGVCSLGVLIDRDRTVKAAGGFLLTLMPGAGEDVISRVEKDLQDVGSMTSMLSGGMSCEEIAALVLKSSFGGVIGHRNVKYTCRCSERRVVSALVSLGVEELEKMKKEMSLIEVTCRYCPAVYRFKPDDIIALIKK